MRGYKLLQRAMKASPSLLLIGLVIMAMNTVLLVWSSFEVSSIVESVASSRFEYLDVVWLGVTLAGAAVAAGALSPCFAWLGRAIILSQVDDVVNSLAHREMVAPFAQGPPIDDLATRIVSNTHRDAVGALPSLLRIRARGWAGVLVLATVSPLAAFLIASFVMVYGRAFTRFLGDVLESLQGPGPTELRQTRYVRSLLFNRRLAGELRVFAGLPWLIDVFRVRSESGRAVVGRSQSRHAGRLAVSAGASAVALLAVLIWAVRATWVGAMDLATLTLAVQGALMVLDLGPAGDAAVRARQVYELEREIGPERTTQCRVESSTEQAADGVAVACNDLLFAYKEGGDTVIDIPDLVIRSGERVAVVGRNGAGKSTLLGLLAGTLCPVSGTVDRVREPLAVALQQSVRYPATLRENVQAGDARVGVEDALRSVGESTFAELGERLDEDLGSNGGGLSGGQWQRVGLARALARLRERGLLILDEPSAALDPEAERRFFEQAVSLPAAQTVVLSTHHLGNTEFVGRILVLDGGKIVDDGSHSDLMSRGGLYAELFLQQARLLGVED